MHCLLAEGERLRTAAEQQQANKSTTVRVRCSGGGNGIVFVIEQVDRAIRSWREDAHYFCRLSRHYFWRGLLSLWFALFYTLHAFARTNTHIHTRTPVEWRATNAWQHSACLGTHCGQFSRCGGQTILRHVPAALAVLQETSKENAKDTQPAIRQAGDDPGEG